MPNATTNIIDAPTMRGLAETVRHRVKPPGLSEYLFTVTSPNNLGCSLCQPGSNQPISEALISSSYVCHLARQILEFGDKILGKYPKLTTVVREHLALPGAGQYFEMRSSTFIERAEKPITEFLKKHGRKDSPDDLQNYPSPLSDTGRLTIGVLCVEFVGPQQVTIKREGMPHRSTLQVYRIRSTQNDTRIEAPFANWQEIAAHIAVDKLMPEMWRNIFARLKIESLRPQTIITTVPSNLNLSDAQISGTKCSGTLEGVTQEKAIEGREILARILELADRFQHLMQDGSMSLGSIDRRMAVVFAGVSQYLRSRAPEVTQLIPAAPNNGRQQAQVSPEAIEKVREDLEKLLTERAKTLEVWEQEIVRREAAVLEASNKVARVQDATDTKRTQELEAREKRIASQEAVVLEVSNRATRETAEAKRLLELVTKEREGAAATLALDRAQLERDKTDLHEQRAKLDKDRAEFDQLIRLINARTANLSTSASQGSPGAGSA